MPRGGRRAGPHLLEPGAQLRRLERRAAERGDDFDMNARLESRAKSMAASLDERIANAIERRIRTQLKKFTGNGACRRCHVAEAIVSFLPDGEHPMFCEPCGRDALSGWQEFLEPERREATFARYRNLYGIGQVEYGLLYEVQGGLCLICRAIDRPLVVDHCHTTGKVRGLLCGQCNSAIGLLQDDPRVISRAASYLRLTRKRVARPNETPLETLRRIHRL